MGYDLAYKPYGKRAILVEWPAKIDKNILEDILLFRKKIFANTIKVIVDIINTYNSLTIIYDNDIENIYEEILALKSIYRSSFEPQSGQRTRWHIPVCYDEQFGIDLQEISILKNIPVEQIIQLHTGAIYTVYFIGFLPGFLYLGGLDERLFVPRKDTPRFKVESGSVAIGGTQTGVYPVESAGGWNIIGRSPVSFFNIKAPNPCFAGPGDELVFEQITLSEFKAIEAKVNKGSYKPKSTIHD